MLNRYHATTCFTWPLVLALACFVAPVAAFDLSVVDGQVQLTTADDERLAVFERFEDVWLVSNKMEAPRVLSTKPERQVAGIDDVETLVVDGGSGLRLRFKEQQRFDIYQNENQWRLTKGKAPNLTKKQLQIPEDTEILALNQWVRFGGGQKPLLARSFITGETYGVLPVENDIANPVGQPLGALTVLPSLKGLAFVSRNGSALGITAAEDGRYVVEPAKEGYAPVFVDKTPENFKAEDFLNRPLESLPEVVAPTAEETATTERQQPSLEGLSAFERAMARLDAAMASIDNLNLPQQSQQPQLSTAQQIANIPLPEVVVEPAPTAADAGAPLTGSLDDLQKQAQQEQALAQATAAVSPTENTQPEAPQEPWELQPNNIWADTELFSGEVLPPAPEEELPLFMALGNAPSVESQTQADPYAEEPQIEENQQALFADAPEGTPQEALFPRFDEVESETPYLAYERYFMSKLYEAQTPQGRDWVRQKLAQLSMAYQRYRQAEGIIQQLPQDLNNVPVEDSARILLGASLLMQERPEEALPLLEQSGEPAADRLLWLAYGYQQLGRNAQALPLFEKFIERSVEYPVHLQRALRLAQAKAQLAERKFRALDATFDDMTTLYPEGILPPEAKYVKARARLAEGDEQLGQALLAEVANSDDPSVAYNAQYDYVNTLLQQGALSRQTAIQHMEDLRFLWRGGELEKKILAQLGEMYLEDGDERRGLERLKYRNIYFPEAQDATQVAEQMTKSFTNVFYGKDVGKLDPLFVLGLYYDFRELTPPGSEGDKLVFNVAQRLKNLGLFDRAVDLMERQLRYRVKDPLEKARFGAHLAQLYLLNEDYEQGLDVLKRTQWNGLPAPLQQERAMLQARLQVALGQYAEADNLLNSINNPEALDLQVDLAWGQNNYQRLIEILEPYFAQTEARQKAWQPQDQLYMLRLAYAYNITNQRSKLVALEQAYAKEALSPVVAQPLSFLNMDMDVHYPLEQFDQDRPWFKLTNALKSYNDLVETYDKAKEAREIDRMRKLQYNRRLGQGTGPAMKMVEDEQQ